MAKTPLTAMALTEDDKQLLDELAQRKGLKSRTDVVRALIEKARQDFQLQRPARKQRQTA